MKKALIVVYLVYTLLRLFTATVHMQREEDPTIILKYVPTYETEFLGNDSKINEYSSKYEWYANERYIELIHLCKAPVVNDVYLFFMNSWFILTGVGAGVLIVWYIIKSCKITKKE